MRYLITGGLSGLGEHLCSALPDAKSVSRRSGYDICDSAARERVAQMSLDCEVFINNAFDGPPQEEWADLGQVRLLGAVYEQWRQARKSGYIINIGSIASEFQVGPEYSSFDMFRIAKLALDEASLACTSAFLNNQVPFKTTLLRFGRLNTELARSRASWTGNGIDTAYILKTIEYLISSSPNTCPMRIDMDVCLKFGES